MAKALIDELNEELEALLNNEVKRIYDAIEEKKPLPLIMTPGTVKKVVDRVVRAHQLTAEEFAMMRSPHTELVGADLETYRQLAARDAADSSATQD